MRHLYSTDPTGETCPTAVDDADYTVAIRQHELDYTDQASNLSALKDLDDELL